MFRSLYFLIVAISLLCVPAGYGAGPTPESTEPHVQLDITAPVTVEITPADDSKTIAQKMIALEGKLEVATGGEAKGFWSRKYHAMKAKYNYWHRYRVGRREVNAAKGEVSTIPVGAVLFNGAAALIGIHVLESLAIGPAMIAVGQSDLLPSMLGKGLTAWGAALINPVPTGIPLIDAFTESFCWLTLLVVKTDLYHRGVYTVEMSLVKVSGRVARLVGADYVWHALMAKQTGRDRLLKALEAARPSVVRVPLEELSFVIRDNEGRTLAKLQLGTTEKLDVKLVGFEIHREASTEAGKRELAWALKTFGWDIRDAILKPEALVAGGHGRLIDDGEVRRWEVEGTSVLLRSKWIVRRAPPPPVSPKTCLDTLRAASEEAPS